MNRNPTANYKAISDVNGIRFQFFCDLSGAYACTTKPIRADTQEQALLLAWKAEGMKCFNYCQKCGRWVSDVMYNADVLECVECAPWEEQPEYCLQCGHKISPSDKHCPRCGSALKYEGR